jgi:tetratricopeptide (TPR) repeat protein
MARKDRVSSRDARPGASRSSERVLTPAAPRAAELPLDHPLMIAAIALATLAVLASVTFKIVDPDVWQHLAVGRAIWQLHHVPTTNLWAWPVYGTPDVCPSWLFRVLLWPFYLEGGVIGLYAWRWLVTLAAFAVLWLTARRMGARGFVPLFTLVLAALSWRHRSQVRPETLIGVLLALELWILESWRHSVRAAAAEGVASSRVLVFDRRLALIPLLWIWANAHISWPLAFAIAGAYGLESIVKARRGRGRLALEFVAIGACAFALAFVNPSGARAVFQPFDYFLNQRKDPLYATIGELAPLMLNVHWRTGLPVLIVGWPLLILWRASARRIDVAEWILCALFTWLALSSQRFAGFYALIAAPFSGRDLTEALERGPDVRPAALRFAVFAAFSLGFCSLECLRPDVPLGIAQELKVYPVGACDYIASHDLHGPFFNEYYNAGYLLWRFWPDRTRLPFIDVHQSATPEDRRLYPYVFGDARAWRLLDQRRNFEVLLVDGSLWGVMGDRLPDILDADSTWTLVFRDDNACLFVRRDGRYRDLAGREGYRLIPAGSERLQALGHACETDSTAWKLAYGELTRQMASSRFNARASSLLANLDMIAGQPELARERLEHTLAVEPSLFTAHERLGLLQMRRGDAHAALREFDIETHIGAGTGGGELQVHRGQALEALGRPAEAVEAYRRQLQLRPDDPEARAALDRLTQPR